MTRTLDLTQNPSSNTGTLGTLQEPVMISRTTACLLIWVTQSQDVPEHAYQSKRTSPEVTSRESGRSRKGTPPCALLAPRSGQPLIPPDGSAGIAGCPHRGGRRPPPTARPLVTKRGEGRSSRRDPPCATLAPRPTCPKNRASCEAPFPGHPARDGGRPPPTTRPLNTKRGVYRSSRRGPPCASLAPRPTCPKNRASGEAPFPGHPARDGGRPPPTARPLVTKRGDNFVYVHQLCSVAMFYSIQFYLLTSNVPLTFAPC